MSSSHKTEEKGKKSGTESCSENVSFTSILYSKTKLGEDVEKSQESLETPGSSLPSTCSLFPGSLLGLGGRVRSVSESQVSVNVDLSPWLLDCDNIQMIRGVREARVRRNSSREAEEAMAAGLSKADIHMPPM